MSAQIFDQAPTTAEAIKYFIQNMKVLHADVEFCSEEKDEMFGAHKMVVGMRSSVLADLLYKPNDLKYVEIKGVSKTAIRNMISCFYDGDITIERINDIRDTLTLSERYEIQELANKCKSKLVDFHVDVSNVLSVLETSLAVKNEAKVLECLTLISENKDEIFSSENFLRMKFENVLEMFGNLKKRKLITEAVFLGSTIEWILFNKCLSRKKYLLEKVNMPNILAEQFLEITERFPNFFNTRELASAWKEIILGIKDETRQVTSSCVWETEYLENRQVYSENEFFNTEPRTVVENYDSGNNTISLTRSLGTNTDLETEEDEYIEKESSPRKIKHLKLCVLNDGPNEYNWTKRVKLTILDDSGERDIKIPLEVYQKGALKRMFAESDEHEFKDVDISYTGLLYYFKSEEPENRSPTPTEYIEVLKTALFFEDNEMFKKTITKVRNIEDYDPVFLDGLRRISDLEESCIHLIKSKTTEVIMHPNFFQSSSKLLDLLLRQDQLQLSSEEYLLKCTMSWLKSPISQRDRFRSRFLEKIAFENISKNDFERTTESFPDFFSLEEKDSICAYKTAEGDELLALRKKLPSWYSFKNRKYC